MLIDLFFTDFSKVFSTEVITLSLPIVLTILGHVHRVSRFWTESFFDFEINYFYFKMVSDLGARIVSLLCK